jgi:hypothetical protein
MNGLLRVPRSRGALTGAGLVLLGAWGALIPFIGPYFHYAYTPDTGWAYTSGRLYLEILPGVATLLGGFITGLSSFRHSALFGAWLAAFSGAWFALGTVLRPVWNGTGSGPSAGTPVGGTLLRVWEQVGFFTGLGVVIVLLAAVALGRFSVIGAREAGIAAATAPAAPAAPAAPETAPAGRSRFSLWRRTDDSGDSETTSEKAGASR